MIVARSSAAKIANHAMKLVFTLLWKTSSD